MKFGMPTLVECKTLLDCALVAESLKLDFIEINMSFPEYCANNMDFDAINEIKEKYGLFYTIHADEVLNPFDFNPKVSECYFEIMKDTIAAAKKIGARIINLHLQKGIYVTLTEKVILLTDVYRDLYFDMVKRLISMCEKEIADSGVIIAIENVDTNPFSSSQISALELFLASPVFALTLDTGHECKAKFADSHVYEKYPEKLMHLHLHDCKSGSPHLPLGTGEVEIGKKVASLRGETCLIEVKTIAGLKESVDYVNKYYRS